MNFFENPIKSIKIRNGIFAYMYRNGCINIEGEKYFLCSMQHAIKLWKLKNKLK